MKLINIIKQLYRTYKKPRCKFLFKENNLHYRIHEVPVQLWMKEYEQVFLDFVQTKIPEFYESLKHFYLKRCNTEDSMYYFRDQLPRFGKTIEILERNHIRPKSIGELASYYPYASYWFHWKYNSDITLYDIINKTGDACLYDVDKVKLVQCDLVTDFIGKHDLYIFSASIEHIPCNLYKLCQKIVDAMPVGAYLYVCYPTGGENAKDYEKDLPLPSLAYHGHLREFTYETTRLFFKQLKVIDRERIVVPCVGYTEEYLYQKIVELKI